MTKEATADVTVATNEAMPTLRRAARFASKNGLPMPILTHARSDGARIVATDLEVGISAKLPGAPWPRFVVRADLLARAVNACGSEAKIRATENGIVVSGSGNFRWRGGSAPPGEYPDLPPLGKLQRVPVGRLAALRDLLFAAGAEPSRPELFGVFDSGDRALATDGVAIVARALDGGPWAGTARLVPRPLLAALDDDDPASASIGESALWIEYGEMRVFGRLIDAAFPDVAEAFAELAKMPAGSATRSFEPIAAEEALQTLAPFAGDDGAVRVQARGKALRFAIGPAGRESAAMDIAASGKGDGEVVADLRRSLAGFARSESVAICADRLIFRGEKRRMDCVLMGMGGGEWGA